MYMQYGSDEYWSAKNTIILLLKQRQNNILSTLNHSAMLPAVLNKEQKQTNKQERDLTIFLNEFHSFIARDSSIFDLLVVMMFTNGTKSNGRFIDGTPCQSSKFTSWDFLCEETDHNHHSTTDSEDDNGWRKEKRYMARIINYY